MRSKGTLSANTLFHFTNSSDKLEGILRNEFHPKYCLENWDILNAKGLREIAIPMVSFCDIPLSQIGKHVKYYGRYALGLTKEWGMEKNISPVLYTHKKAKLSFHLRNIFAEALRTAADPKEDEFSELLQHVLNFIKFLKPYRGKLWRDAKYLVQEVTFYDEREWRFCPDIPFSKKQKEDEPRCFLGKRELLRGDKQELLLGETIENENKKLERYKLSFEPKDIKYIIVDKDDERLEMVRKITEIKRKYSYEDLQILTTRILSMDNIFEDF